MSVYLISRLHFYSELELHVKVFLVPLLRRAFSVPCCTSDVAKPQDESTLVLYGDQEINPEVPGRSGIWDGVMQGEWRVNTWSDGVILVVG